MNDRPEANLPGAPKGETATATELDLQGATLAPSPDEPPIDPNFPIEKPAAELGGEGRYVIEAELARGGMGRVMVARDTRLGREVAIKEMLRVTDQRTIVRFWRESLLTARLQHPGIVPVYEISEHENGVPFLTMRRVDGRPLEALIKDAKTPEERLRLLPNALAAVDAVAYAHDRRIIHRDIKPSNVLVGQFGETVVIDWGLAKEMDLEPAPEAELLDTPVESSDEATGLTMRGAIIGTPAYMPPEQAAGEKTDARSDVYSLGALLYQLLTGALPFTGTTQKQIILKVLTESPEPIEKLSPWVSPDLVTIVKRAMARKPADRFANARALADELRGFLAGQLVASHRYTVKQRVARWTRKHAGEVLVTALAIAVLAVVGLISVRRILAERKAADAARDVAEEQRQYLALDKAKALKDSDPVGAIEAILQMSTQRGGWNDARMLAEDIREHGLPVWRLKLDSESPPQIFSRQHGLWVATPDGSIRALNAATGELTDALQGIVGVLVATREGSNLIATRDDLGVLRVYDGLTGSQIGASSKANSPDASYIYDSTTLIDGPAILETVRGKGILRIDPKAKTEQLEIVQTAPSMMSRDWAGNQQSFVSSRDGSRILYVDRGGIPGRADKKMWASFIKWQSARGRQEAVTVAKEVIAPASKTWSVLALSPDGMNTAMIYKGFARILAADGRVTFQSGLELAREVSFDPTGRRLVVVGKYGLELIELTDTKASHVLVHLTEPRGAVFDEKGETLAVNGAESVYVIDALSGEFQRKVLTPASIKSWLIDGWLVTWCRGELQGWSLAQRTPMVDLRSESGASAVYLSGFRVSNSGRYWYTTVDVARDRQRSLLWDVATLKNIAWSGRTWWSQSGDTIAALSASHVKVQANSIEFPLWEYQIRNTERLQDVTDGPALLLLDDKSAFVTTPDAAVERQVQLPAAARISRSAACGNETFAVLTSENELREVNAKTGETRVLAPWSSEGSVSCAPDSLNYALSADRSAPMVGMRDTPDKLSPFFTDTSIQGDAFFGPGGSRGLWRHDGLLSIAGSFGEAHASGAHWRAETGLFSPDGQTFCFVDDSGSVQVEAIGAQSGWKISPVREEQVLSTSSTRKRFVGCGFIKEGRKIVAAGDNGVVTAFPLLATGANALSEELRNLIRWHELPAESTKPARAQLALDMGINAFKAAHVRKAIDLLLAGLDLHPTGPEEARLHRNLGVAYMSAGQRQEAAKHFRLYLPMAADEEREKVAGLIDSLDGRSAPVDRLESAKKQPERAGPETDGAPGTNVWRRLEKAPDGGPDARLDSRFDSFVPRLHSASPDAGIKP